MLMTRNLQFRFQMYKDGPLQLIVLRKSCLTMGNRPLDLYRLFRV
jgi:hypothetical protein